jgi:hypothetical protein
MTLNTLLLLVGSVIIAVLVAIAAYLHWQLYLRRKAQAAQAAELARMAGENRQKINNSIQIIAEATLAGNDLTLTEASMRIAFLLDSLGVSDPVREEFSAFYQLRDVTAHIPFLDAWKQLSRKEQTRFDLQRMQHEATYGDFVLDAARRIRGREF